MLKSSDRVAWTFMSKSNVNKNVLPVSMGTVYVTTFGLDWS